MSTLEKSREKLKKAEYLDVAQEVENIATPGKGFRKSTTTMILKAFHFIETLTFNFFGALWKFSSHSLVKTISVVTFCVLYEIFVYLILAVSCVFISIILQTYDMVNNRENAKVGSNLKENPNKSEDLHRSSKTVTE